MPDPNPILDPLAAQVTSTVDVMQSATVLINGFAQRLTDAVAKAVAGGATADQLAPIVAEVDALKTSSSALAAAVAANSPPAPAPTP